MTILVGNVIGESRHSASRFILRNRTTMVPSRTCLGYDDAYIYAVSPDSVSSYDIQQRITSVSRNGALNSTDSFMTCVGHQNQLYIGAIDPNGNTNFLSYRVSSTPQHQPQISFGSQSFDTTLDRHQLNVTSVISMIPIYLPTSSSGDNNNGTMTSPEQNNHQQQQQQQQPCVVISSNDPGKFNGLYQVCDRHGASFQKIPFPDQASTAPLLATNNAHSLTILLGYPTANSIYVYSNLGDLSKPDAIYEIDIAIPSRGFVQVLNDGATEFLIFDYNRKITHIQLASDISKQKNMVRSPFTYELDDGQRHSGAIALANHQLFTVSDNNDNGYVFEEISLGARLANSIQRRSEETPAVLSISPSPSTAVIGIIIGGSIALVICLSSLGIWLFRRNRRNRQRHANTEKDEARSYLNLEDPAELLPSCNRNTDTEDGDETLGTNMADRQISGTPLHQLLRHRDTINNSNNSNTSIRRGLDTFIQRMASLRSPQSPTSNFSLFSNISSTPPPVVDRYRKVKHVHFPSGACELMEPTFYDSNGTLILNGHYQSLDDQAQIEEDSRIPGYATRTIQHATKDESIQTLHYYPANQQNAFLRNINITLRLQESNRVICHHDALAMESQTRSGYQYYWISGLCMAQQSLDYLLHDQNDYPTIVDTRQFNFMSLSVLSILSCIRDVHALDCCHLGLSLRSFYYQKVIAITEWYVGRFDQAHVIGQPEGYGIMLDVYSAPELVREATTLELSSIPSTTTRPCLGKQLQNTTRHYCYKFSPRPALDCWSLGCVIYEVATGTSLFKDFDQLYQLCCQPSSSLESHLQQAYNDVTLIHPSFRVCLENLLQVNPIERATVELVLDGWIKANQLDEDLD